MLCTTLCTLWIAASSATAPTPAPALAGDYLEIRTCDTYTGPCFANAEVGLTGREAALAWRFDSGELSGVDVAGLSVVALVRADATLGNPYEVARDVSSVLLVDAGATVAQQDALAAFAAAQLAPMGAKVAARHAVPIAMASGCCDDAGCASLEAGAYVAATTRCVHDEDKHCGNESIFYPPLQDVTQVTPAVAETFRVDAPELDVSFTEVDRRGAFTARFAANGLVPATEPRMVPAIVANLPAPAVDSDAPGGDYKLAKLEAARDADEAAKAETAIPTQVPEAFAKLCQTEGWRLTTKAGDREQALYDVWLAREIAITDAPKNRAIAYPQIPVTTFLGVLKSHDRGADYRNNAVPAGVYAMRFGTQPQDGNHLGTAPMRDFVVLTKFEHDTDPAALADMKALEELAIRSAPVPHPLVLHVVKPEVERRDGPQFYKHTEREEWIADVVVPARVKDAEQATEVRIGIVLVGHSEHP